MDHHVVVDVVVFFNVFVGPIVVISMPIIQILSYPLFIIFCYLYFKIDFYANS